MVFDPNFKGVSVFVDVNDSGEIRGAYVGKDIIANRQYGFFFYVDEGVANNITDYKVILNGYNASLVLKEEPIQVEIPSA